MNLVAFVALVTFVAACNTMLRFVTSVAVPRKWVKIPLNNPPIYTDQLIEDA